MRSGGKLCQRQLCLSQHSTQKVVEIVSNTARQRPHALQLLPGEGFLLSALHLGQVDASADVADESLAWRKSWSPSDQHAYISIVCPANSYFRLELLAGVEARIVLNQ